MRTKVVNFEPRCEICGCSGTTIYEIPTIHENWKTVCNICRHGLQAYFADVAGCILVYQDVSVPAIELSDPEEVIMGRSSRWIECPTCHGKFQSSRELKGGIQCRKCTQKLQVPDILELIS